MGILWSPWRKEYLEQEKHPNDACVFCQAIQGTDDKANLVLHRNEACFIIFNRYPYNNGHLLVVPYRHVGGSGRPNGRRERKMSCTSFATVCGFCGSAFQPNAVNIGMNLGAAAGAGILDHVHMHIVPRWEGDTNYMTVFSGTRVISEALEQTYERLAATMAEMPFRP